MESENTLEPQLKEYEQETLALPRPGYRVKTMAKRKIPTQPFSKEFKMWLREKKLRRKGEKNKGIVKETEEK